jgi:hypothetical protein
MLTCALVATVGCALVAERVPITGASLGADGRTLELEVGSCNAEHALEVDETAADEVRITVTARGDDGNDCMDGVRVVLEEELNGRTIVDGSTGDVIGVE